MTRDTPPSPRVVIPVTLLTGYLGSGKTTLLNRLLADPAGRGAAVLVNEFGEVGLDHLIARPVSGTSIVLANGCLCCSIHGELRAALREMLDGRSRGEIPPFDRLMIETSGLSDPLPVIMTLTSEPMFRHRLRLAGIVTTVDALNGVDHLRTRTEAARQAAMADRIVVTKTDLQEPTEVDALIRVLAVVSPQVPVVAMPGAADLWPRLVDNLLRTQQPPDLTPELRLPSPSEHLSSIRSFSIMIEGTPDWSRFAAWLSLLMHRHGRKILRIKGLLRIEGDEGPMVLNAVQNYIHPPEHLDRWPNEDRRSRLVFITDGVEEEAIRHSLLGTLDIDTSDLRARFA